MLKLHCYAVINVLGIWAGRPSAARFLYLRFSRNYLYLFYLYIFPIRSGNVLINFLRTFAEAFYTQGFIYTKKLPKLTLASTCLCLHNRNVFLKKSICKKAVIMNATIIFCQAFFALKFALFNVYLSFKYTLNFIFYKEIKNLVDAFHYTVGILNIFTLKLK